MLISPASPICVARASPTCELCAQTTILERPPFRSRCASSASSVSAMCVSRRFQDETRPSNIDR